MEYKHTLLAALCGLSLAATAMAADSTPNSVDPEADRWLRAACDKLATAKAYTFKAEVWTDVVVEDHKITTTKTVEAQVRRPDRVHMETRSPRFSRGFWYDGKTFTLLDRPNNLYGSVAVSGTIDQVLDVANDQYGINFPLEDVLVNDPYPSASKALKSGVDLGKITILGTPCHHVAFSTERVDWQLWIQDGPNPLPRKLVITYKQEEGSPQYTAIFSDWNLKSSVYLGKITILGTPCHHVAFSTERVDWQLWIQDGPNPLPRKLVITYKQEEGSPQYTAIFSDWNLKSSLSDKTFVFTPPKGAAKIEILPAKTDE